MGYPAAMRKAALCALLLPPLAAIGCTALIGDFDVRATSQAGGDGATDGAATGDGDTDGSTDGSDPDSADAQATVFSTCGLGTVRTIDEMEIDAGSGGGTGGFNGQLQVIRTSTTLVRVIAQKNDVGDGATVYSFDPKKNGSNGPLPIPDKIDLQLSGRYLDARRLVTQGILSLLFLARDASPAFVYMNVIELPDNDPTAQQSIPVSANFNDTRSGTGGRGNVTGALGTYATNNEYFWAVGGWPSSSAGSLDLIVGHRVNATSRPSPVVIHTTSDDRLVRVRDMARSKNVHYLFNDKGPDAPGDPGASFWAIPDDATGAIAPRTLAPAGAPKPYVVFGSSGLATGDGIRVAAAEVDFNATNFGIVRAGVVSQADLDNNFDGTKIPQAFTLTSLADVPAEGEARFFGDDMLWLGTPPDPLRGQGLNFIWYNTTTRVTRAKSTGAGRLALDRQIIERASLFLDTVTLVNAELDVVFVERVGTKSVLQYARMTCIK